MVLSICLFDYSSRARARRTYVRRIHAIIVNDVKNSAGTRTTQIAVTTSGSLISTRMCIECGYHLIKNPIMTEKSFGARFRTQML